MQENGLVVVNENFFTKITKFFNKVFFREKKESEFFMEDVLEVEYIEESSEFIQEEIVDARSAFRKYVINNKKDISENILSCISTEIMNNQSKIKKLMEINEDDFTFEDIITLLNNEVQNIKQYKLKKNDNMFQVPIGVIGVECNTIKESIENIFKAISTRNSIIILKEKFNQYETDQLILLIVKECLRKNFIDDNIIQMMGIEEVNIDKLDKYISKNEKEIRSKKDKVIYLYQENEQYHNDIQMEVLRLQGSSIYSEHEIHIITGEFADVVDFLSENKANVIGIYTNNSQRAYKLMNWIDTDNLFINMEIGDKIQPVKCKNEYFAFKNIKFRNIFN